MARFWISWHQPTEDKRPMSYPPNASILGWWCSGYGAKDVPILCALVSASSATSAKGAVLKDWPEAERWRFAEKREENFLPSDRFPLSDWMKERTKDQP